MLKRYSKIMILGCESQLGMELRAELSGNCELYAFSKKQLDITNSIRLYSIISEIKPDIIFNTAAYTNVAKAEIEHEKAYSVNGRALFHLGLSSSEVNALVVHFSTDYVFDGEANSPYTESCSVNPINIYGKSKLLGEKELARSGANHIIVRFGWLYGRFGDNFLKKILGTNAENNELRVVADQFGTPTSTKFIVENLVHILNRIETFPHALPKLLHLTPSGQTNWFGFAEKILEFANAAHPGRFLQANRLMRVGSSYYDSKVLRPKYTVLSKETFETITSSRSVNWEDNLGPIIDQMMD